MGFGSNGDANANRYSYCNGNSDSYRYGNANSDCYCDAYSHSYSHGNVHIYPKTLPDSKKYPATKASTNSAAAPVAVVTGERGGQARSANARSRGL